MYVGKNRDLQRPLDFLGLEHLRLFAQEILRHQWDGLHFFEHDYGFKHLEDSQGVSVASSATCVLSLIATDTWSEHATPARNLALAKYLLKQDTSADLERKNPFTIAWILEAVTALEEYGGPLGLSRTRRRVVRNEEILRTVLKNARGGVRIKPYPESAYLTQLVVRVLHKRSRLTPALREAVREWAWLDLYRQLSLIQSASSTADPFAIAYLLMLVTTVTPSDKINPEQASVQRSALKTFFDSQREDGTWPRSRPLFHYPKVGSAFCYEYEMLTQLLQQDELQDLLIEYLPQLEGAAEAAKSTVYRVEGNTRTWTSGHHPQKAGPESWATASVYHFFHSLDRLAARAVRKELFNYLDLPFPTPKTRGKKSSDFAKKFLDSDLRRKEGGKFKTRSLKTYLWDKFVKPLWEQSENISNGRRLSRTTPRSAIFFGPPGTSKTDMSQRIADFLGWPLLAIDPSHLLRNGMDGIQAEANTIFRRLEQTERVVVLFDEFDELVRDRASSSAEPFSRLLTTAMLPKLARLHEQGTLVFIIATNNIGEFDLAIRRLGRFDQVVQIMPPTYDEKARKKDWGVSKIDIVSKLRDCGVKVDAEVRQKIADLTYLECDDFASHLATSNDKESAESVLDQYWNRCTLQGAVSREDSTTWAERCRKEAQFNT